jgi:hypothetical protein
MIESLKLSAEQMDALRSKGTDWLQLTDPQLELIRKSGLDSGYRCMFLGDRMIRMPIEELTAMLKTAFRTAWIEAMWALNISDQDDIADFDMAEPGMGYTHFEVTLKLKDGRIGSGFGELVVPSAMAH